MPSAAVADRQFRAGSAPRGVDAFTPPGTDARRTGPTDAAEGGPTDPHSGGVRASGETSSGLVRTMGTSGLEAGRTHD